MIEAGAPDFWLLWYVGLVVVCFPMGLFGFFLGALAERLIADERSSSSCF